MFRLQSLSLGLALSLVFLVAHAQQPTNKSGGQGNDNDRADQSDQSRFDAARFLKDHDKNNDGKLSKDELPSAAADDLKMIDRNKDSFITQDELQQHAETMANQRPQLLEIVWYTVDLAPEPLTAQELQDAYDELRKIDKDKNGKIDQAELKACREDRKKERVDNIFTILDQNNDKKLAKDEARGVWSDNFATLDRNKDGILDRKEIEAACSMQGNEKSDASNVKPRK